MIEPKGVGIYTMALDQKWQGTPKAAAKRAADHGVSFVAILACWQEVKRGKPLRHGNANRKDQILRRYAEEFKAKGIDVWIWGFPWAGAEKRFVESMASATGMCSDLISGWILDPEVGYKWSSKVSREDATMRGPEAIPTPAMTGDKRGQIKSAEQLINLTLPALGSRLGLGVTSYGMAKYHPNFPWEQFGGYGFGSPQLYSVNAQQVDQGIAQWREYKWRTIIPSVPTFGKNSGPKLHEHLSRFVDGAEDISGFLFWVWRATSASKGSAGTGLSEWDIIARWADWLKRGACTLPAAPR